MIEIVAAGIATTVQDLGRRGLAHIGVPASGMVDTALGTLMNRLVGNPEGAALLETCGGLVVRAVHPTVIASSVEAAPRTLTAGEEYRVPAASDRLWHYVAVRGGLEVEPVLGSRSTDTLSGLGPTPVESGTRLAVGPDPGTELAVDIAPLAPVPSVVRLSTGPRADWFAADSRQRLDGATVTVTSVSRIGVRLEGAPIHRVRTGELPSEGLVRGAVQVPPSGELVVMLADHPTTGGYPVIAVVDATDVAAVAQQRPGAAIRLRVS